MSKQISKILGNLSIGSAAAALGIVTVNTCMYNVDAGHRGLLFDNLRGGIMADVKGEGTHLIIPIIQRPIVIDVRTQAREIPSVTGTKDLQIVNIKVRVLWRPQSDKVSESEGKRQAYL